MKHFYQIEDIFQEIEDRPIGTASLAQCHRAILKDGTKVAVKIQHPDVKKNSDVDIQTMMVCHEIHKIFFFNAKVIVCLFCKF